MIATTISKPTKAPRRETAVRIVAHRCVRPSSTAWHATATAPTVV